MKSLTFKWVKRPPNSDVLAAMKVGDQRCAFVPNGRSADHRDSETGPIAIARPYRNGLGHESLHDRNVAIAPHQRARPTEARGAETLRVANPALERPNDEHR